MRLTSQLKFIVCVGWLIGLLHFRNPVKCSEFKLWLSPYTCFSFICNSFLGICVLDAILHPSTESEEKSLRSAVTIVVQGFVITSLLTLVICRLYFLSQAKSVSTYLKAIGVIQAVIGVKRVFYEWRILCSFVLSGIEACVWVRALISQDTSQTWLFRFNDLTSVIIAFPAYWMGSLTQFIPFALILISVEVLVTAFENLCENLESSFDIKVGWNLHDTQSKLKARGGRVMKSSQMTLEPETYQEGYQCLSQEFDRLRQLFELHDHVLGPLLLILVVSCTLGVIQASNNVMEFGDTSTRTSLSPWIAMVHNALFLSVLETGHRAKRRIDRCKRVLNDARAVMEPSGPKEDVVGLLRKINKWDWNLSAAGFFNVNRRLIAGIMSTMMTYVLILFQLRGKGKLTVCTSVVYGNESGATS